MTIYLVDIEDPEYGYWDTWEIDGVVSTDEAMVIAQIRLDRLIADGKVVGDFRLTNVREEEY